ncbi:Putative GroES-like superfamily, alcohol dehydrogenase-like, NAD(P)-binding domain superfamily [Colletotrichum destructivum]|uniref:GroES-like superfamily, alcohol dehydrogenase-like, NAD(P)-binding domain superfamily n=1 Tax=Colletotrichum destructivum TaxID=34406 RepID=A0AAX4I0V7_9PEZI|nr:Putative GroES-like superfamily, alcohol dehydrogenase-like, NAD(P)-binding domain superfamily [Colletotrichum destructivum]
MVTTQQVFRLSQRTSIRDLETRDEPIPEPSSNEVLIHIRSVALNFRDYAVATGKYPFPVKDDVVPCSDLSGDVVKVGSHVDDFAPGDRVISVFDISTLYGAMKDWNHSLGGKLDGALRQYIALPSAALVKIPAEARLSYSQLAALVCTGSTAWNSLYGNIALKPGQTVLFLGTGGVSVTGLILAKAAGATTIITSSSDSKLKHVQETYGADFAINYKTTPDWSQEVLKITKGQGADFIFENGGAGTIAQSINAVAYGGSIAVIGFLSSCSHDQMPDVAALALSKGAVVRGIMVGSKQHLEEVSRYVVARGLKVPVEKEFGPGRDEIIAAFDYLANGTHVGKVCVRMS